MNSVQAGTAIALVVAGVPLYRLVTSGDLDATTALLRGSVVAAACVYGVTLIVRLANRFEADAAAAKRRKLDKLFSDMEGAVADGALTSENDASTTSGSGAASPPGGSPPR